MKFKANIPYLIDFNFFVLNYSHSLGIIAPVFIFVWADQFLNVSLSVNMKATYELNLFGIKLEIRCISILNIENSLVKINEFRSKL